MTNWDFLHLKTDLFLTQFKTNPNFICSLTVNGWTWCSWEPVVVLNLDSDKTFASSSLHRKRGNRQKKRRRWLPLWCLSCLWTSDGGSLTPSSSLHVVVFGLPSGWLERLSRRRDIWCPSCPHLSSQTGFIDPVVVAVTALKAALSFKWSLWHDLQEPSSSDEWSHEL